MKFFKKIVYALIVILVFMSCSDNLTNLNKNPKRPDAVPAPSLFSSAELILVNYLTSVNVNFNVFELYAQYWTETTYPGESRYVIDNRTIPNQVWGTFYRDILKDLDESKKIINANEDMDASVKANQLAYIEVLEVFSYFQLVNVFGDIPYTEALNIDNTTPKYDDAQTVYMDLLSRLDTAIGNLDPSAAGFGSADIILGGDTQQWIKFANGLKLRMGMTLADVDNTTAQSIVEAAAGNTLTSNADNVLFNYISSPPNTNPIWIALVQSGRHDFVPANTIVDTMNTLQDPRRPKYFTLGPNGNTYIGGTYGASNTYSNFSHVSGPIKEKTFPGIIMTYSEIEFLLAEAVERGYNVGGTAAEHYNAGIRASMEFWGVDQQDMMNYMSQPEVAYATASGSYKAKIGLQKWLALYLQGLLSWNEWKRLDYPILNVPPGLTYDDIPIRYTYPISEQNLNTAEYQKAADKMGGDAVNKPVFWDVN